MSPPDDNFADPLFSAASEPDLDQEQNIQEGHENPGDTKSYTPESGSPSQQIGNYKLLQPIGEGGMGTVWMADQTEPIKRRVALKLIKKGLDSKPIIARFEAERQALALMDHSSIAKILDGGTTESGQPYFVMELVQGLPITQYCDKNRLGLPERLGLFNQVCNAVQHAHQKGIIHRDLKPANILVGVYDGEPVPKVIDFGLAKALDHQSKLTDKTLFTEFGAVVGTLQYMSPEQADLDAVDIDTRADIYALGVLLYELLTGSTPIEVATLKQLAVLKVLESIRETDPPRPSTRLSSSSHQLVAISGNRQIDPARLQSELRGDLDWIVMKALEKDRSRRYESASGFAADVERYLTDQPVVARPPTNAYKLAKFFKKNRGSVIAAGTMLILLLAGLLGTSVGLFEANRQTKKAEENLARAVLAEKETKVRVKELEEITAFQTSQLSGIDVPMMGVKLRKSLLDQFQTQLINSGKSKEEVAAEESDLEQKFSRLNFVDASLGLLDENVFSRAEKVIEDQYKDKPLMAAGLLNAIGQSLYKLGRLQSAEGSLRKEVELRTKLQGPDHLATLEANKLFASSLKARGKLAEAEPLFRGSLETCLRILGSEHPLTLSFIHNLASLRVEQGKLEEGEQQLIESLEKRRRILGDLHPDSLNSIRNMAVFLDTQGKSAKAEPLFREALEVSRRILGKEHPDTLALIDGMAGFLSRQGKSTEAEPLLRESLETHRKILGNEHPATLTSVNNMAVFLGNQGKLVEAEPLYRETLVASRRLLGNEHPATLRFLSNMASFLYKQGKSEVAEPMLREALEAYRFIQGNDHPDTLRTIGFMGSFLQKQGRLVEAEPLIREALAANRRILGNDHPDTMNSINNLAGFLWQRGKSGEAEPLFREGLEVHRRVLGNEHPETLTFINNMAGFLSQQGRSDEAELMLRESIESRRRIQGDEHPDTLTSINSLAKHLYGQGRLAEAEPLWREVLELRRRILGNDHPATLSSVNNMAAYLVGQGLQAEAEKLFRESLETRRRILSKEHPETLISVNNMASFLEKQGKWSDAEPLYLEALETRRRLLGNDHPDTLLSINNTASFYNQIGKTALAEPLFREALETRRRILGDNHPDTLTSVNNMAYFFERLGMFREAEPLYREAILGSDKRPELRQVRRSSMAVLASILNKTNRSNEAIELLSKLADATDSLVFKELAESYLQLGQRDEGLKLVNEYVEQSRKQYAGAPNTLYYALRLATRALNRMEEFSLAEPLGRESLDLVTNAKMSGWELERIRSTLGVSMLGLGQIHEARPILESSWQVIERDAAMIPLNARAETVEEAKAAIEKLENIDR